MTQTTIYRELELTVDYDFVAADPGNPDIESRTCCPPTGAYVIVHGIEIRVTESVWIDMLPALSSDDIDDIEAHLLAEHS